jgi:hypothetical protein
MTCDYGNVKTEGSLYNRPGRSRGGVEVYDMTYLLTVIGLSPGGSTHLHANNTWNNTTTEQHK